MVLLALISAAFGMIEGREDALSNRAETHEYDALSRMARWRPTNGSTVEHDRTFVYDGSSRLVRISDAVSSDVTDLHQDVDDAVVREVRAGVTIRRFLGHRTGPDDAVSGLSTSEPVLPGLRLLDRGGQKEVRISLLDVDGHAALTWRMTGSTSGTLLETDVSGIYGAPILSRPMWLVGEIAEVDGLHGSEPDRGNGVVHFGARHMLHRDGMWMQPEPLLITPRMQEMIGLPGLMGRSYAAANPLLLEDRSGKSPLLLLAGCSERAQQQVFQFMDEATSTPGEPNSGMFGGQTSSGDAASGDIGAISNEQMQSVIDQVHTATFGPGAGGGVPMTITVSGDGSRVIVTQVGQKVGPAGREKAVELLPDSEVEFPAGTTGGNGPGPSGDHAEARGVEALNRGGTTEGARQASTHYSCKDCEALQEASGVTNVTGNQSERGTIVRQKTDE